MFLANLAAAMLGGLSVAFGVAAPVIMGLASDGNTFEGMVGLALIFGGLPLFSVGSIVLSRWLVEAGRQAAALIVAGVPPLIVGAAMARIFAAD